LTHLAHSPEINVLKEGIMLRILLKREESYAVHALLNIAENPGTNAAEIAQRLKLPSAFIAKVLRKLVEVGFIESKMGRSGGVTLKVKLEDISLLNAIEVMSGTLILDTCQTQAKCATQRRKGHCNLKAVWLATTIEIRELLAKVKLSQLLDEPASGRPQ
jgi:Rrf2 family protein